MAASAYITRVRVVERTGNVIKIGFDQLKPNPPKPPTGGAARMRVA